MQDGPLVPGERVLAVGGPFHGRLFTYVGTTVRGNQVRISLREVIEDASVLVSEQYIDPDDQTTKTRRVPMTDAHALSVALSPETFAKHFRAMART